MGRCGGRNVIGDNAWRRSDASDSHATRSGLRKRNVAMAASLFLASCEGTITTDLVTSAPADPTLQQVVAPFMGIEFERSDGGTERFAFDEAERIDLLTFVNGTPLRILTDEELPEGTYTGVRLLFDADSSDSAYVLDGRGAQRDLTVSNSDYAPVNFAVEEEESSSEEITLTLDLRMSLSVDDRNRYTLQPKIRSVRTEDAGELEGTVSARCLSAGSTNQTKAAIYLFSGRNVSPDDIDGQGVEPYATTAVMLDGSGFSYRFPFIDAGSYTATLVCDATGDDPLTDDELTFRGTANVEISEGETTERNFEL
jgi:hypothetical protein